MKGAIGKYIFFFFVFSTVFGSCATSEHPVPSTPATFYPQNSKDVTVRMINGGYTAFIDNEKYRITVKFDGNFEEKGETTDFIVGIISVQNKSPIYHVNSK